MPQGLSSLRAYAVAGARIRLEELRREQANLLRLFPELKNAGRAANAGTQAAAPAPVQRRKRRRLSAAQRKAISERIKRYWAERRKAKAAEAARAR